MNSSYFGNISFRIFGSSHGEEIGITAEGLPAGFAPDTEKLMSFLKRRSPVGKDYATGRKEPDVPEFISGIKNGVLSGTPFTAVIKNKDIKKSDYEQFKSIPRPGHADYTAFVKYSGKEDMSGGGHFSGRMTAPLCILGGICIQILEEKGINVISRIKSIGKTEDEGELVSSTADDPFPTVNRECGEQMIKDIIAAKAAGDSLGGIIECKISGLPAGVGEAMFDGLESRISKLVFGIPAVKGIEFGSGFSGTQLKGSQNNDEFFFENGKVITKTNNCGGILGGISNGMPISFNVAFKPTPSISVLQNTVNLKTKENTKISISGRHDPCIVPRAVPCIEAAAAIAIYDAMLSCKGDDLSAYRREIDRVDTALARLFSERMEIAGKIAEYKFQSKSPIYDGTREKEKLSRVEADFPDGLKASGREFFETVILKSREHQQNILSKKGRYGLLGKGLSHSFSPAVHGLLGCAEYRLFDTDDLESFMSKKDFDGINVTSPYKKAVIPFLDRLSDTARKTGSVNTVIKDKDGKLTGYNTDVCGFTFALKKHGIMPEGKKIIVLGTGGASASVICALKDMGASDITVISRTGENNYGNIERQRGAEIIVNATPVGMYPNSGKSPISLCEFKCLQAVIDLIYNPSKTELLLSAEEMGIKTVNGLSMLTEQARASEELFFGNRISAEKTDKAEKELRFKTNNIVIIGMPGCGKSVTAKEIAAILGREAVDSDKEIEKRYGKTAKEIITEFGEEKFRKMETEVLKDICSAGGKVISCGGGVVERKENFRIIRQNSTVVYLKRKTRFLKTANRPISQKEGLENLFSRRDPLYRELADVEVTAVNGISENAGKILEAIR